MTEDEMVGWHHRLNGHEFEQTPEDKLREAWHAAIHGVSKSQTWLSSWTRSNNNHPRKVSHALPPTQAPRTMDLFLHLELCPPQNATPMGCIARSLAIEAIYLFIEAIYFKSGSSHAVLYMTYCVSSPPEWKTLHSEGPWRIQYPLCHHSPPQCFSTFCSLWLL